MLKKFLVWVVVLAVSLLILDGLQPALGQSPYINLEKPVADRGHAVPVGHAIQNDPVLMPQALTGVGDWSKIVYQSFMSGNWEIYLTDGNGNKLKNLTNHPGSDFGPRLVRGAASVAFASNRDGNDEIYTSLTSGGGLTRLTFGGGGDYSPDWSPQGNRIVFVSERDGNPEIYVMNADGTGQTRLTNNPAPDTSPAWSPDGQRIAWVRYTDNIYGDILAMNPSGGNQTYLLTHRPFLGAVAWAPDSVNFIVDFDVDWDYWNEVVLIDPLNGMSTLFDAGQDLVDLWVGGYSPDGKWVIYSRIEYYVDGNRLLIDHAFVNMQQMEYPNTFARLPGLGLETDPDWMTADIFAPVSQVLALPKYSRQNGVYVAWSGNDIGPGGITNYDVQYRLGNQGAWTDWYRPDPLAQSAIFPLGSPGEKVYFRVRARDAAGNIETWPANPDGDAFTNLYTWNVAGSVSDNRGRPVFQPQMQISPSPLALVTQKLADDYTAWLGLAGQYAFQATQVGYSSSLTASLSPSADLIQDLYLPPPQDWITNGGFEDQLAGWQITGTTTLTGPLGLAHTGQSGLLLNEPCQAPCFSDPFPLMTHSQADMLSLKDGTLVIVYEGPLKEPLEMYAVTLPPGGELSSPTLIGSYPRSIFGSRPVVAADGQENLYAAWQGGLGVNFSEKPLQGSWTEPQVIAVGEQPALGVDWGGGVHIIYRGAGINYLHRLPDGTWQTPVKLSISSGYMLPDIAVGPEGTVYFLWQEINEGIFFRSKSPDGVLTPVERLFSGTGYSHHPQRIVVGPGGELHAFWVWGHSGYYQFRPPGEAWLPAQVLPNAYSPAELAVDSRGVLHMIGYAVPETGYYRSKNPVSGWSEPAWFFPAYANHLFTLDPQDQLHVLIRNTSLTKWEYRTARLSSQARIIAASQPVTIPPEAHEPTLSFFYTLDNLLPNGQTFFQVSVADRESATPVFTTTAKTFWSQAWADLSPWVGKAITVTLSLHQAAAEPEAQLSIDDLSLGDWLTPLIEHVDPGRLEHDWTGQVITISGENFSPGAVAFLGGTPLTDVAWLDPNTLQASIPAGVWPGIYYIEVVNPDLLRAIFMNGVILGNTIYLPVIRR